MIKRGASLLLALIIICGLLSGCGAGKAEKEEKVLTVASNMNLTTMEAWRTTDDGARSELVMQAQEKWLYDTVYLPMYFAYGFQAYNGEKVKDLFTGGVDSIVFSLTSRLHNVDVVPGA